MDCFECLSYISHIYLCHVSLTYELITCACSVLQFITGQYDAVDEAHHRGLVGRHIFVLQLQHQETEPVSLFLVRLQTDHLRIKTTLKLLQKRDSSKCIYI